MNRSILAGLSAACALVAVNAAQAEQKSPIFGNAVIQPTTQAQNKDVVGKGYYADLYGYYGNYYAYYAYAYGNYGYTYKYSGYYSTASTYAYAAYVYYYYASYYQANGS